MEKRKMYIRGREFEMLQHSKDMLVALYESGVENWKHYEKAMYNLNLFADDDFKVNEEIETLIKREGIYTAMEIPQEEYLQLRDCYTKVESLKKEGVETDFKNYSFAIGLLENEASL